MYDYILPVSNKDIVNIAKRAFNRVDPRLMGHGERVANIMFQIMEAEGGYTPVQMRNLLTLAVLHDIGAYKTEEIDHMVEFETKHVWNHSIYGYLFLNYFSLFKELSRVVLFHHSSWKQLEQMDDVPGHVKKAAQLLQLADLGFLDQDNCRAAVDLLLRSRLTEATAFLLDYCNRRWPRETAGADTDFLDAEFAL